MPDLLVNLSKVPPLEPLLAALDNQGIQIRRAQAFEISALRTFIKHEFSVSWADEVSVGFANKPVSIFIATLDRTIIGFAAYECTRRSFFGPTAVSKTQQGRGIGTALLIASLHGLSELGYVYGIIGGAGPVEFYRKTVGAIVIPDSTPGIYTDILR
jgi:predicted N-acetyltransferase YhbS